MPGPKFSDRRSAHRHVTPVEPYRSHIPMVVLRPPASFSVASGTAVAEVGCCDRERRLAFQEDNPWAALCAGCGMPPPPRAVTWSVNRHNEGTSTSYDSSSGLCRGLLSSGPKVSTSRGVSASFGSSKWPCRRQPSPGPSTAIMRFASADSGSSRGTVFCRLALWCRV